MPPGPKSGRQASRIPQSSRLICLKTPCRTGRPYEYLKVPGSNASNPHVEPEGHTNTSKPPAQTPPSPKSSRQAIRIPKSSRLKSLKPSCRAEGPHEYLKVPGSKASNPHVAPAGHTNTSKFQAQKPQIPMSHRQAIRIPQSSRLKRLKPSCRAEGPYEYLKAPGSIASNPHVEPKGHTNTSKFQAQLPQTLMSSRKAIRIPKSSRLKSLKPSRRTGGPHEYLKAARSNASRSQVEPAGHTNTSKFQAHLPQTLMSHRQAKNLT